MINQHINVPNKYSNEAWEKSPQSESTIKINNHHNQHVNASNEYNNHTDIKDSDTKSSQCVINSQANRSTKRGRYPLIHQSNATFSSTRVQVWPSYISPVESPFCGPRILLDVFPLDGMTCFFILFGENLIFLKKTWSHHLF